PRENELEPGLAEAFDEIDDLAARVAGDVAHTRGAQSLADEACDREFGQVAIRPRNRSHAPAAIRTIGQPSSIKRAPSAPKVLSAPVMTIRIAPGTSGHQRPGARAPLGRKSAAEIAMH